MIPYRISNESNEPGFEKKDLANIDAKELQIRGRESTRRSLGDVAVLGPRKATLALDRYSRSDEGLEPCRLPC